MMEHASRHKRQPEAASLQASPQQQQQQQQQQQLLPVLDSVLEYEKLHRIGEGTYGVVYKARHIPTGQIVALKKVRFDRCREGVPVTSVRELAILQQAQHPNIVRLLKVVTGSRPDSVFLVFEYCEHDLGRLLDTHQMAFSEGEAKCLFRQLLSAVSYLHNNWVLHRDLKMSNLLYSNEGLLKLCDFGLARHFHPHMGRLTPRVVTLWYRAPELLLGADCYSPAIDCWSLGCILGELLKGEPLFPASTEAECLQMLCQVLGTPVPRIWPAMNSLPHAASVRWPDQPYNLLRRQFPELSDAGLALLNGLLTYDPAQRLTAKQALESQYFRERPYPRRQTDMPSFPSNSNPGSTRASAGHGSHQQPALRHQSSAAAAAAAAAAAMSRRQGSRSSLSRPAGTVAGSRFAELQQPAYSNMAAAAVAGGRDVGSGQLDASVLEFGSRTAPQLYMRYEVYGDPEDEQPSIELLDVKRPRQL